MNARSLLLSGLVAAAVLLGARPAAAHSASVLVVRFQELADGSYQLDYLAPPGSPQGVSLPILPPKGAWDEELPLPVGPVRLRFTNSGKPLEADDCLILPWRCDGVMVQSFWRSGETARRFLPWGRDGIVMRIGDLRAGAGGTGEAAKRYAMLGARHILLGWEHLLVLAGLLLLVQGRRRVVATFVAFSVAHSLTLGMTACGWLRLDKAMVDVLVAMTIVLVAVEIIHLRRGRSGLAAHQPWWVAVVCGLIHGVALAGSLVALGLPQADLPLAWLFFNLGVEGGQLLVIGLWFGALAAARRVALRLPGRFAAAPAYALGICATCWCVDRLLALFA